MAATTAYGEPLYSSLGGDPDLGEIVDMFVDEMPGRIAMILAQLESGDLDTLQRTAHQLKGSAGSYGFDALSPCAAAVETAIKRGDEETQIEEAVGILVGMCRRVMSGAAPD